MPHVQITWVEGRSPEQKRNIAAQITQTLETEGRAKRENIHVAFLDVPKTRLRGRRSDRRGSEPRAVEFWRSGREPYGTMVALDLSGRRRLWARAALAVPRFAAPISLSR